VPRKLEDKRKFEVADAGEALVLIRHLADSLFPLMERRRQAVEDHAHMAASIDGERLSVESGVTSIAPTVVADIYAEADAEAIEAKRISVTFYYNISPEATISWFRDFGGVTVDVRTSDIGWGHEVLELADRVAAAGRPVGFPASPPAPAAVTPTPAVVAPVSTPAASQPIEASATPPSPAEETTKNWFKRTWRDHAAASVIGIITGIIVIAAAVALGLQH